MLCLLAAGVVILAGCGRRDEQPSESIADIQKREGFPVRVMAVERGELQVVEKTGGTVEGLSQTTVGAAVAAKIVSVDVTVGDRVRVDQVVMRLDREAVSSHYVQARAAYDQALRSRDRLKSLVDEGGASRDLLDQAETGLIVARSNFDAAAKSVDVLAPFSGTVVEIFQPVDRIVDSQDPLMTFATLERIRVKMNVNEAIVDRFEKGQPAFVPLEGDTLAGGISLVSMAGFSMNHSFEVEAVFDNPVERLKPGMFVTVHTVVYSAPDAVSLPIETILAEGEERFVYLIREGRTHMVPVQVGVRGGGRYEILDGIAEGDFIVLEGASVLEDGAPVRIVD